MSYSLFKSLTSCVISVVANGCIVTHKIASARKSSTINFTVDECNNAIGMGGQIHAQLSFGDVELFISHTHI